mgnify:FL=1
MGSKIVYYKRNSFRIPSLFGITPLHTNGCQGKKSVWFLKAKSIFEPSPDGKSLVAFWICKYYLKLKGVVIES